MALCHLLPRQWDAGLPAVPCGGQTAGEAEQLRGQGACQHQWLCQGEGQTGPCPPQVTQVGARTANGATLEHGGGRGVFLAGYSAPLGSARARGGLNGSVCVQKMRAIALNPCASLQGQTCSSFLLLGLLSRPPSVFSKTCQHCCALPGLLGIALSNSPLPMPRSAQQHCLH